MGQPPPIIAEQSDRRGCGCLVVIVLVAIAVAGALGVAGNIRDRIDDLVDETTGAFPDPSEEDGPEVNDVVAEANCRAARELLPQLRATPLRTSASIDQLLPDAPPKPYSSETMVRTQVNPDLWISGLGNEPAWHAAFERFGYAEGMQHFWGNPAEQESTSMQALRFGSLADAKAFHAFFVKQNCRRSVLTGFSTKLGAIEYVAPENGAYSIDATFVRGPYFLLAGFLRPTAELDMEGLDRLGGALDRHLRSLPRR